jgi:hypothetical protein
LIDWLIENLSICLLLINEVIHHCRQEGCQIQGMREKDGSDLSFAMIESFWSIKPFFPSEDDEEPETTKKLIKDLEKEVEAGKERKDMKKLGEKKKPSIDGSAMNVIGRNY